MPAAVHVADHPLVQHSLSLMREQATGSSEFRHQLGQLSRLLAYELTRGEALHAVAIRTPVAAATGQRVDGSKTVFVAILRAGLGLLEGMLETLPGSRGGHIGLYRDPHTLEAIEYYFKLPHDVAECELVVVDPMLATGHTAVSAITRIKQLSPRSIRFVCVVACPEGIAHLHAHHPEVPILTAAIDSGLNEHSYIVPGLGDAGDRCYGTRE
ncbi:uracil phosphoribosyltransferase [Dokdonella sp.]|uniref:uracil phosphoribosyltransferase n=1 Tax=Dokdonella sp. TaxID=2291710 RepID=UPI0025BD4D07|nr:uracil phosphoribosyltransferase [Dokdonella sp.]MBX3689894.1 uracil phosphoribosyltransferase [Dokdonella sp.]